MSEPNVGVAAVVVHYRCEADLAALLASLAEHAPSMPVVVVENGSADGSAERLAASLGGRPATRLVVETENRGFGAGCNRGIDAALAAFPWLSHVLLLNPDTRVEARCVEELLATAQRHPDAGIVGGRIVSLDGRETLFENGRFPRWTLTRLHVPAPPGKDEFETEFVTGALMLVDANLLRDGLRFDERFFLYVEDLDLCREVVERGRTLWITTRAVIRHREGGSQADEAKTYDRYRPSTLRWITRGKAILARKRLPAFDRAIFFLVAFTVKPLAGLLRFRSLSMLRIYYAALVEGMRSPLGRRSLP